MPEQAPAEFTHDPYELRRRAVEAFTYQAFDFALPDTAPEFTSRLRELMFADSNQSKEVLVRLFLFDPDELPTDEPQPWWGVHYIFDPFGNWLVTKRVVYPEIEPPHNLEHYANIVHVDLHHNEINWHFLDAVPSDPPTAA